jgi:CDP-diacylglycerol--serine O-phosphatidyltransferase
LQGLQGHGGVIALVVLVTLSAAMLMVSNLRYYSFKDLDLRNRIPFAVVLGVVLVLGLLSIDPPLMSLLVMLVYAGSGVVLTLNQLRRSRSERRSARAAQRDAA